jgi:hypothetical protein
MEGENGDQDYDDHEDHFNKQFNDDPGLRFKNRL